MTINWYTSDNENWICNNQVVFFFFYVLVCVFFLVFVTTWTEHWTNENESRVLLTTHADVWCPHDGECMKIATKLCYMSLLEKSDGKKKRIACIHFCDKALLPNIHVLKYKRILLYSLYPMIMKLCCIQIDQMRLSYRILNVYLAKFRTLQSGHINKQHTAIFLCLKVIIWISSLLSCFM